VKITNFSDTDDFKGKIPNTVAFIQCITKILESSKSYTRKIYVGNIGAYPRQTSIIVLQ
jgi:hypothetical protein